MQASELLLYFGAAALAERPAREKDGNSPSIENEALSRERQIADPEF
jgi:hypothetical protein